ncbi:DNA polymerase III subunit chi [Pontibacterium sp.]|uniref:DNA polymerase III subunit chi n=1 Tax=Pontibacterium sp. TaxID=2036026 RepID=UPI003566727D
MSEADFYVLPASDPEARSLFLCRLCEKVMGAGKPLHIHCASEEEAAHLDQLLWEHKPEAFLPHTLIASESTAPITLGWGDQRPEHLQVFVNMALDLPEDALKYARILEVVVQVPDVLQATRKNYRLYQDNNITVRMNDMRR